MSVQINHYLILGIRCSYEDFKGDSWHEKFEPYMDSAYEGVKHHKGLCVIFDGMNGNYVLIGRVLAKTGNYEGFDEPLEISKLATNDQQTRELIAGSIEGQLGIMCKPEDVHYIVVSHHR